MTAKDLKSALLQEAVQGKLVPQIASEGNARDLLAAIQAEKAKLIKEGKLKKEKPLPEITDDEIPFDIPENWCWCRLGEIVSVLGDGIHGTPNYDFQGKYYFINGNNLSNGKIVIKHDTKKVNEEEYQKYKKELNENTVFVSINGTLGNIAFYNNEKIILGKSACYFNLIKREMKFFMFLVIKTKYFLDYANEKATGTTIKNVSLAAMKTLLVPIPPLVEQKRIVEAIEQFMPLIDAYGKKEAELTALNADVAKTLKNAILQEAVQGKLVPQIASEGNAQDLLTAIQAEKSKLVKEGELKKEKPLPEITDDEIPFDIPESWCWCRITDISTCELGKTKDSQKNKGELKDYLCSVNIQENGIDLTTVKQMKFEEDEFERYTVKKGDLLICEGGDAGRCAIYDKEIPIYYQNALHRIRFFNEINPFFYLYLFQFYKANNMLSEASKGVTIQHLTGAALKSLCFPLPPLAEQKRIVEAIERLLPLCEKLGQ